MDAEINPIDHGTLESVESIYRKLRPFIQETPLLEVESLSKLICGKVLVKPESLQKTGAFKFRGALYRLMMLNERDKKQGVTAFSSGNFARGLAAAGDLLGIPINLVMPHDAPENKIRSAQQLGANVQLCHSQIPSREEAASLMAAELARNNHQILLHPFDDPLLIRGQASVAEELKQQLHETTSYCDHILCPVGGGSLVAGTSLVFSQPVQIWAIETRGYQGMYLSLKQQKPVRAMGGITSDCDALQALEPGVANLDLVMNSGIKGLVISNHSVHQAMRLAFSELNIVLEPSGAIALAAIIEHPQKFTSGTVVVIATGGNVDQALFSRIINGND